MFSVYLQNATYRRFLYKNLIFQVAPNHKQRGAMPYDLGKKIIPIILPESKQRSRLSRWSSVVSPQISNCRAEGALRSTAVDGRARFLFVTTLFAWLFELE